MKQRNLSYEEKRCLHLWMPGPLGHQGLITNN